MDKMREEFEAWWISKNPNHTDVRHYWHETGYWANSNSTYSNLDFAWECWKASRASLCVELPQQEKVPAEMSMSWQPFCKMMSSDVIKMLDDAGVSYK